jgi:hypothetical protein
MTVTNAPYYFLTCQGKLDNLLFPACPMRSNGGFVQDDVIKAALLEGGWTEAGNGHRCPACSYRAAQQSPKPIVERKPRAAKVAAPPQEVPDGTRTD